MVLGKYDYGKKYRGKVKPLRHKTKSKHFGNALAVAIATKIATSR